MKTKFLILALSLLSYLAFCQKVINKAYKFSDKELKVAMIPLSNEMEKFNDSISNDIFKDFSSLKFLNVARLRSGLNDRTISILKRIASKKHKKSVLKKSPNLNTLISTSELNDLKEYLNNADLMLFPIVFNIRQSVGMTFGNATFRFYDLNTGDFIHQFKTSFNIDSSKKGSKEMMTALLFLEEKNYLKTQKNR